MQERGKKGGVYSADPLGAVNDYDSKSKKVLTRLTTFAECK
jgi:hypothetical protein